LGHAAIDDIDVIRKVIGIRNRDPAEWLSTTTGFDPEGDFVGR